jgi:hypothetical protein
MPSTLRSCPIANLISTGIPSKKPPRPRSKPNHKFAFFQHVRLNGNEVIIRRWPKFGVRIDIQRGCGGCEALKTCLQALPCVSTVQLREVGTKQRCHFQVDILAPTTFGECRKGEEIGSLTMPTTQLAQVFHRELMTDLRVRRPFSPLPHQTAYSEQFSESKWPELPPGILLGFALGSGKTHAALHLASVRGETRVNVICAVSLIGQWKESIETHAPSSPEADVVEYRMYGYDRFAFHVHEDHSIIDDEMVVVDESHTLKNMSDRMLPTIAALERASCCQFLTGTPVRNDVRDFDIVLRLLGLSELVPDFVEGEAGYGDRAWGRSKINAPPPDPYASKKLLQEILKALSGRVALYNPRYCEPRLDFLEHYPQTSVASIYHELTWEQTLELFLYGDGVSIRINTNRRVNIGAAGGTLRRLSILNAVVTDDRLFSSKADALVQCIREIGRFPQVVYSRFKTNLLQPLSDRIANHFDIPVCLLTGDTPAKERQPLLDAYNRGEIGVLLICSVGSEGLDLTAQTAAMHLLEPQHNIPEEQQIVGRVVRFLPDTLDWKHTKPIAIVHYVCRFPTSNPSSLTVAYLTEVVNENPAVVEGFTGKRPGRDEEAREVTGGEIIDFLKRRMGEEGSKTEEETMYKSNQLKYGRTRPLEVLLWMASKTTPTPNVFRNEWAGLMGEPRPKPLPEPERKKSKKQQKKEDKREANRKNRSLKRQALRPSGHTLKPHPVNLTFPII